MTYRICVLHLAVPVNARSRIPGTPISGQVVVWFGRTLTSTVTNRGIRFYVGTSIHCTGLRIVAECYQAVIPVLGLGTTDTCTFFSFRCLQLSHIVLPIYTLRRTIHPRNELRGFLVEIFINWNHTKHSAYHRTGYTRAHCLPYMHIDVPHISSSPNRTLDIEDEIMVRLAHIQRLQDIRIDIPMTA